MNLTEDRGRSVGTSWKMKGLRIADLEISTQRTAWLVMMAIILIASADVHKELNGTVLIMKTMTTLIAKLVDLRKLELMVFVN